MNKNDFKLIFVYKSVYWDNTAWYWIYLINFSGNDYKIHYETDGFITVDDEVHKLNSSEKDLETLKANSRILIEENDIGSLDMNWFIHLTLSSLETYKIDFSIWKWAPKWKNINIEWFNEEWILMDFDIKQL